MNTNLEKIDSLQQLVLAQTTPLFILLNFLSFVTINIPTPSSVTFRVTLPIQEFPQVLKNNKKNLKFSFELANF